MCRFCWPWLQFLGSKNSLGGDEAGEERERSERLLEFLASNANESVRRAALEALGPKGRAVLIPQIEKRIRQDTGTTLRLAVSDAIYLRAGELVPALTARLAEAQGGGRRLFIQGLGQVGSAGAIEPLVAEFLAQPQMLNEQSGRDTVTYAALQLANIPESVKRLIELHGELGGVGSDGELGKATELGGDAETRALRRGHLRNFDPDGRSGRNRRRGGAAADRSGPELPLCGGREAWASRRAPPRPQPAQASHESGRESASRAPAAGTPRGPEWAGRGVYAAFE
jgi:hypothetical protein